MLFPGKVSPALSSHHLPIVGKQSTATTEKIGRLLVQLTKGKKGGAEKIQINRVRDKEVNTTTDTNEIQNILKKYFQNLKARNELLDLE